MKRKITHKALSLMKVALEKFIGSTSKEIQPRSLWEAAINKYNRFSYDTGKPFSSANFYSGKNYFTSLNYTGLFSACNGLNEPYITSDLNTQLSLGKRDSPGVPFSS